MALKSRSYIIDLDRVTNTNTVRLSFGFFFFLSCLMERFFYQRSGSTIISRPGQSQGLLYKHLRH